MKNIRHAAAILIVATAAMALQGCLATKIVTVPVKVVYGTGKLAVKGTAAAVRAVVPGDKDKKAEEQPQPQPASPEPAKP